MSVNSTVANTRSGGCSCRCPVRNSSTSPVMTCSRRHTEGDRRRRVRQIVRRVSRRPVRVPSRRASPRPGDARTSVGTLMASCHAAQIGQPDHRLPREKRHLRTHGGSFQSTHPLPPSASSAMDGAAQSMVLPAPQSSTDRRRHCATQPTRLCTPNPVVPAPVPNRDQAATRSGYVPANSEADRAALGEPEDCCSLASTASSTASRSSARLSMVGTPSTGSDKPVPRLS